MVKFLVAAAVAVSALLSGAHAAGPCVQADFTKATEGIGSLNQIIDLAVGSGMISKFVPSPITVKDMRLDAIPLDLGLIHFEVTPIIQQLDVNGIATVLPRHINATGPTNVDFGVDFSGEVTAAGTIRLEIAQVNRKWYDLCWTNVLKPQSCPPAVVDMDIGLGLLKPSIFTNIMLALSVCSPYAQAGSCTNLSANDIITAALSGDLAGFLARVMRRVKDLSIADLKISFDKLTKLNFHFHKSGPLITEVGKKLFAYTTHEINEKGPLYKGLITVTNKLGKTLINKMIKDKLAPQFGNTCYDA